LSRAISSIFSKKKSGAHMQSIRERAVLFRKPSGERVTQW